MVDDEPEAPPPADRSSPRKLPREQKDRPADRTRVEPPADPAAANAPDSLPAPERARAPESPPLPAARPILPVSTSLSAVFERWAERRAALREQDQARAAAAAIAVLEARRELAIDNLVPFAFSAVRDADRSLAAGVVADALAHAELAVRLAPELADAHATLARVRDSSGEVIDQALALWFPGPASETGEDFFPIRGLSICFSDFIEALMNHVVNC